MTELKFIEDQIVGKKYKPNITFLLKIAVPCCPPQPLALLVDHDGQNDAHVSAMLRLADEGKAPYCVSIGVYPGVFMLADGTKRQMRMNCYDLFDREYADFLIHELIPYVTEKYDLNIDPSPEKHLISGGSSGGISAFVAAWFYPDYFRRVYMSSPSFLAMGRGNEIPYLIRKYETKPIKVYEEFSETEPNNYYGSSNPVDASTRDALIFAKYDFAWKYFPGEGHCSQYRKEDEAYERLQWIWQERNFLGNSQKVDQVIPPDSKWERCDHFPAREEQPDTKDTCFDIAVYSNDRFAVYCGRRDEDIVYMIPGEDAGAVENKLLHATLHTIPRIEPKGTIDLAVDKTDRLYVLTAVGIQCVRSFGIIDVILDLPDSAEPLAIAITDKLYVKTSAGIYCRALRELCTQDSEVKRKYIHYND